MVGRVEKMKSFIDTGGHELEGRRRFGFIESDAGLLR